MAEDEKRSLLVIGGTSGIGMACADSMQESGHVMTPEIHELDVRDDQSVGDYFKAYPHQRKYNLLYCAGVNYLDWGVNLSAREMANVHNVNVIGLIRVLKQMDPKKVVVIGSDAAHRPMRTSTAYNASKAALEAAVQCLARENRYQINIVAPGVIYPTPMTDYVFDRTQEIRLMDHKELWDYMVGSIPSRRFGTRGDVAKVVKFLFDDAPEYLQGETIRVNGGR